MDEDFSAIKSGISVDIKRTDGKSSYYHALSHITNACNIDSSWYSMSVLGSPIISPNT